MYFIHRQLLAVQFREERLVLKQLDFEDLRADMKKRNYFVMQITASVQVHTTKHITLETK